MDPDAREKHQLTPQQLVCQNGNVDVVKKPLLNDKMDPNSRNEYLSTPLHCASQFGHFDVKITQMERNASEKE